MVLLHEEFGVLLMKVLIVVNVDWFFFSHRIRIAELAKAKGHEVHVATTFTDKKYRDYLEDSLITTHELEFDRSARNWGSLFRNLLGLISIIRTVRPDVVHLVTLQPVLLGGIAARLTRVKGVIYAISGLGHTHVASSKESFMRKWVISRLYVLALGVNNKVVVFQNRADERWLAELCKLKRDECEVLSGSGVDLNRFRYTSFAASAVVQHLSRKSARFSTETKLLLFESMQPTGNGMPALTSLTSVEKFPLALFPYTNDGLTIVSSIPSC